MGKLLFRIFTFFSLLVFSCKQSDTAVFEKINVSSAGDFRGVTIRSAPAEVKKAEGILPKNEEDDYLFYEISLSDHEEYYTVGYSFNEKGLYEILLDVYLEKPDEALQLFADLKANFVSRYGAPVQEDDQTLVWTIKTSQSDEVEVTLSDESQSYNSGKISVSFYDLSYE